MYDVTVTREDGLWVADIAGEGLGPAATDTERFGDAVAVFAGPGTAPDRRTDPHTLAW
jgi:hypothetical protein